jgi:anti-sigma factor RsiW
MNQDQVLIARLFDGALNPAEADALRERMKNEPGLRRLAQEHKQLSRFFAAGREAPAAKAPAGFAASVLGAIREEAYLQIPAIGLCRRLAWAAIFLVAATLLAALAADGFRSGRALEAAPSTVRDRVEALRRMDLPDGFTPSGAEQRGQPDSRLSEPQPDPYPLPATDHRR